MPVEMAIGAGRIERRLAGEDELLRAYEDKGDTGLEYLRYSVTTPRHRIVPEDLAVTLLVNSRATAWAFQSLRDRGPTVDLSRLSDVPLEAATDDDLGAVARVIAEIAQWPGFGASIATKVAHKKRPALIPVLDNMAIFGAYMNPRWPGARAGQESVKSEARIREALEWIRFDVARPENEHAWPALGTIQPGLSRIELFDSVWWKHFRKVEPPGAG